MLPQTSREEFDRKARLKGTRKLPRPTAFACLIAFREEQEGGEWVQFKDQNPRKEKVWRNDETHLLLFMPPFWPVDLVLDDKATKIYNFGGEGPGGKVTTDGDVVGPSLARDVQVMPSSFSLCEGLQ
jgi:hypothetical protein